MPRICPAREAEVAQHAEFAPAREHDSAEARREPEEAHHHRYGLHRVGDGEAAIEDAQRHFADLARLGDVELLAARQCAQRGDHLGGRRAGRAIAHRRSPSGLRQRYVVGAVDKHGAVLARIVAEHPGHQHRVALVREARGAPGANP